MWMTETVHVDGGDLESEARSPKPEARSQKPEARSQKPDA